METDSMEDKEILAGLIGRPSRQHAFQLLVKKNASMLYNFLRQLGLGHEDTDEQLQEILVGFWRKLDSLKEHNRLDKALYGIAVEAGFSFLRSHGHVVKDGLSPEQQMVITLKQHDFDHHEIASLTALPLNEVRDHFRSALNKIMEINN